MMCMTKPLETCTGEHAGNFLVVKVLAPQLREAQVAYKLRDEIITLIAEPQPKGVVLDLSNATFIGSVGFLSFLGVRRHLKDGRIILCNLSVPIRDMFAACRLIPSDSSRAAPFETAENVSTALGLLES